MIKFKNFMIEKKTMEKTLYIERDLLNGEELVDWAKDHGFEKCLLPKDMHITCAYSKEKVDWNTLELDTEDYISEMKSHDERSIVPLGDAPAIVLKFWDDYLKSRWQYFINKGASWDHNGYKPHVTISYSGEDVQGIDFDDYYPTFPLIFGPEKRKEVDTNWDKKIKEE